MKTRTLDLGGGLQATLDGDEYNWVVALVHDDEPIAYRHDTVGYPETDNDFKREVGRLLHRTMKG